MADEPKAQAGQREWRWAAWVILGLVAAGCLPTLLARAATPEGRRFTGLLFNPQDGNSYLAKMRQGLMGSWHFRLPYTPEPHEGAPIYLFYLLLGHAARWTGISLPALYHIARLLGGAFMLAALYRLAGRVSSDAGERRMAFSLAATGAGLGWLVVWMGVQTADLWVPEAFPVYALLANPHFPLSIGLMISIADCGLRIAEQGAQNTAHRKRTWAPGATMTAAAALLGAVQPFGLVTVFGGMGVMLLARAVRERAIPWREGTWIVLAGAAALPYPLYTLSAIRSDPVLAAWDAQNVTTSPPLWDWVLSYGLVLVLGVVGGVRALRRRSGGDWLLLGWIAVTLAGMYLPLPLQRRLSLGLGAPLGLLAGVGWWRGVRPRIRARRRGIARGATLVFCALTPLLATLLALAAAQSGHPLLGVSENEWAALEWLRKEAEPGQVVLCAPETGGFVPAWTGQRVVYGHPFETVDAERRRAEVESYWTGEMDAAARDAFLAENDVSLILVGPRERDLGGEETGQAGAAEVVFQAEEVVVYKAKGRQGEGE